MLENFSRYIKRMPRWKWWIVLPIWTYLSFLIASLSVSALVLLFEQMNLSIVGTNVVVAVTAMSAIVYVLALAIAVGVPYWLWKDKTTRGGLGVSDWPTWMDIALVVPAYVVYMICSAIVMLTVTNLFSGVDIAQPQELPFSQSMLGTRMHFFWAFTTLVMIVPLAEEMLFRGYLYGKLKKFAPVWVAILISGAAFGLAHLWTGGSGPLQWAVAVDTFVMGLVLGLLRDRTGAIWAGVLLHALKNGIAFYFLFINPQMVNEIRSAVLPLL